MNQWEHGELNVERKTVSKLLEVSDLTVKQVRAAIRSCAAKRKGKRRLKKKAPNDPLANAAWQAVMSVTDPSKMDILAVLSFNRAQEEMYVIVAGHAAFVKWARTALSAKKDAGS